MKSLGKSDKIFKTWSGAIVLKYSSISVQNPIFLGILNFLPLLCYDFATHLSRNHKKNKERFQFSLSAFNYIFLRCLGLIGVFSTNEPTENFYVYYWLWNNARDFEIERVRNASLIWNHKYSIWPKLLNTQFDHHVITVILKSQDLAT